MGHAVDVHGVQLTGTALVWTDDLDGALGTGEHVTVTLSAGMHTITLSATDGAARVGATKIQLNVSP